MKAIRHKNVVDLKTPDPSPITTIYNILPEGALNVTVGERVQWLKDKLKYESGQ